MMFRECECYKDEYKNCTAIRGRFHQFYVHGKVSSYESPTYHPILYLAINHVTSVMSSKRGGEAQLFRETDIQVIRYL